MKTPILRITLILTALTLTLAAQAQAPAASPAAARRSALLQQATKGVAALPALSAALEDENLVVRRTAARLLIELGAPAKPALIQALCNTDLLVRRAALSAIAEPPTIEVLPQIEQAAKDREPLMRLAAVNLLVLIKPRTQAIQDLLEQMRKDESQAVRDVAGQAVWPFFRENISLRERKDWDHDIKIVQTIPLPLEGWRFKTDPKAEGHLQKWFDASFNDSAWSPIKIEATWEEQGNPGYDGIGWYRGSFDLPEKPQSLGAELEFGAVDEIAWVWVNGQYVGQHDLGTEGWDKTFALDVTKELKWGQKNQITVRVSDSAFAGGIWKPINILVLQ